MRHEKQANPDRWGPPYSAWPRKKPPEPQTTKEAWGEYLDRYRWDYFITVTFRFPRQPHHADSTIREVGKVIEEHTNGRYFLGTELHVNRTLHVHGLLQAPHGADDPTARMVADTIWRVFLRRFGRSQVRRVQLNEAVSAYVSKYVVKGFTSWDMRL